MSIKLRQATAIDQPVIEKLIKEAHLNTRNIYWTRFLIAEDNGKIVGIRQVKRHKNGTREVASGLVIPEYRHQGISTQLMNKILETEKGQLYLICDEKWYAYYAKFGFSRVATKALPGDLLSEFRIGKVITSLISIFTPNKIKIIPLKRESL